VTHVKVCGVRTIDEGRVALESGASYLGFVMWQPSKRYIAADDAAKVIRQLRAESLGWSAVGVFVDPTPEEAAEATRLCGLDYVQLSGHENARRVRSMPAPTIKAIHVQAGQEAAAVNIVETDAMGADLYLLDTHADGMYGGTGQTFDWNALRKIGKRCLAGGGLRPDNVALALATLEPLGVDVSSGVEYPSGGKDPVLVRAFLEAVRRHDDLSARIG
jgi:phosphoribosylanthranilate isomerase